jgi:5-methylcytosine-specific restriction endonuclease McrA
MKRINPNTHQPFKYGDVREDGFVFVDFRTTRPIKKDGTYQENWLKPEIFNKQKQRKNTNKISWNKDNFIKRNIYSKKHAKENPEQYAAKTAKRRASKLQRTPAWLTAEDHILVADYYQMAKELELIFPWKQHVDHILPLQGKLVSGLHTPLNLQILSEASNLQKSNKTPA